MQAQFNDIYKRTHRRVYNLALHYLQNIEDTEEITQDVFVEVHEQLKQFRAEAQIDTWVYRVAVNKCLDALRYKKRKKRFGLIVRLFQQTDPSEDITPLDIPHFEHPGVLLEQQENTQTLYAAINQLNDNQRTAFTLVHIEEMPQKQVAEIMQLSVGAVESLLQRAKANLRQCLEKEYLHRRK